MFAAGDRKDITEEEARRTVRTKDDRDKIMRGVPIRFSNEVELHSERKGRTRDFFLVAPVTGDEAAAMLNAALSGLLEFEILLFDERDGRVERVFGATHGHFVSES